MTDAVIVTYNSAATLASMLASAPTRAAFSRIVVADNGSTDATRQIADQAGVDVLGFQDNRGFGSAANAGIATTSGDIVALLNPDIEVEQVDAVERLLVHFADPRVAVVGPALRLPHGEIQDSARLVPTPVNLVRRRFVHRRAGGVDADGLTDASWVVGAAMLIRRSAFDLVGGFDGRYLIYFEDVDLCVRLRRAGFAVRVDPGVVLAHQHAAASRRSLIGWSTRQHIRSAALFYRRFPRHLVSAR